MADNSRSVQFAVHFSPDSLLYECPLSQENWMKNLTASRVHDYFWSFLEQTKGSLIVKGTSPNMCCQRVLKFAIKLYYNIIKDRFPNPNNSIPIVRLFNGAHRMSIVWKRP